MATPIPAPSDTVNVTITPAPIPDPVSKSVKAGWLTSEHLLSFLAILLTALLGSNIFPDGSTWLKAVAIGATVLTSYGYTVSRTKIKVATANAETLRNL